MSFLRPDGTLEPCQLTPKPRHTNTTVPASRERSTGARVLLIVASAVAGLTSAVLITLGGLAFLGEDQKDERGYLSTDSERFQTGTRALASESLDVDLDGVEGLIDSTGLGDIRIEVEPDSDKPVFVGIARTDEVDDYLRGVAHSAVVDVDVDPFEASYSPRAGRDRPEAPGGQRFWAASAHGAGAQTLTWEVEDGDWSVVVMNEDGSPEVRGRRERRRHRAVPRRDRLERPRRRRVPAAHVDRTARARRANAEQPLLAASLAAAGGSRRGPQPELAQRELGLAEGLVAKELSVAEVQIWAVHSASDTPLPLPRACIVITISTRPSGPSVMRSTSTRHSSQADATSSM